MTTIRRTNLKAIRAALAQAAVIICFYDDGQETTREIVRVDDVMARAADFRRVTADDNRVEVDLGGCHSYTAYRSLDFARRVTGSAVAEAICQARDEAFYEFAREVA